MNKTKSESLNVEKIREDFPILKRKVNGKDLVYLDNAATSQKPMQVIRSMNDYYAVYNANVHRAVHKLAEEATIGYEGSREKIARFINASPKETIFVRNTTEGMNLAIFGYVKNKIKKGDTILLTEMEHHSNIVPWQKLAKDAGAKIQYIPITKEGILDMNFFEKHVKNASVVSLTHVSNVLGTINPVREIIGKAKKNNAITIVDGAQSVPHMPVDVKELNCDFLAFSAHKMLGPTGIGILYGKKELLEETDPIIIGSEMIKEVTFETSTWNDLPWKFDYGTANIAEAIGFGAAIDYLQSVGMHKIRQHEEQLTKYALEKLQPVKNLTIYGPLDAKIKGGVISFNLGDVHSHDLASVLDQEGIAIRSGHHCAMPLMSKLGITNTSRASFYLYNTEEEIDMLVKALEKARGIFKLG